ncbi:MAG TPA: DUF305 domain-containing protein [Thermomicrobiales bacterium]|nr:DUF305 domain-containing protein [Thermomicrobiales bacterium]
MKTTIRTFALAGVLGASLLGAQTSTTAQSPTAGCGALATPAAGMMDHGHGGHGMDMGTPGDMHGQHVEFDQMYIDMMIPHHESVMALAEVALPELTDSRLKEIARAIIDAQGPEIAELEQLRDEWYGSPEPAAMDDAMMGMMMEAMPGMGSAEHQMQVMSADWQVQTFCAAADKDLAFIDQVIPHHQMAIDSSRTAVEKAIHPELKEIAARVITDQQAEIDELEAIRADLTGAATPAS